MNEKTVTVNILGRNYRLKVREGEERFLTAAAESIESQIKTYKQMYGYGDNQDLLAMVAIARATQLNKLSENRGEDESKIKERLLAIEKILKVEAE